MKKHIDIRYLKVYHHCQRWNSTYFCVPRINLCGKWLEEAGFKIGDQIEVIVHEQFLLIVRDKNKSIKEL